jgi:uncharacterized OB-fold protein
LNRRKAILKPIPVSDADREYLNAELASKNKSPFVKNLLVKKIIGGYCSSCGAIATQNAIFDAHGATLIEKYCDECCTKKKYLVNEVEKG